MLPEMVRTAGLISIAAIGCALGVGCGSFGAANEPGDAGRTAATATFCADLKPFREGFDEAGWASGWNARGSALHAGAAVNKSPPNALVLEVAAGATTADESWIDRPLGTCRLKASAWIYFEGAFGDGEVDFFGVTDGPSRGSSGVLLVAQASAPGEIQIEQPNTTASPATVLVDTWSFVEIEIDPVAHHFSASVDQKVVIEGALDSSFGAEGLTLKVGASWIGGPPKKPWTVYFDDLSVSAP